MIRPRAATDDRKAFGQMLEGFGSGGSGAAPALVASHACPAIGPLTGWAIECRDDGSLRRNHRYGVAEPSLIFN